MAPAARKPPSFESEHFSNEHDYYVDAGYTFKDATYSLPDGRTFTVQRPVGAPGNQLFYPNPVTLEQILAIWAAHAEPDAE
jgi:hypothetical protein